MFQMKFPNDQCRLPYKFLPVSFLHFLNVYLFLRERERERASKGGAERGGDTESETGSRLRAVGTEPDAGLEPTNREMVT